MEIDNIELRSEKVRNIIGQIPPIIIRAGISVIFFIIIVLLIGTWFFKYQYTIKSTASIVHQNSMLLIDIEIPANEIDKVKKGQKVILDFNNVSNLYNIRIITKTQKIPDIINISEDGGFYLLKIKIPENTKTESGQELIINQKTIINAEIITDKISLFQRIAEPFKSIINHKD